MSRPFSYANVAATLALVIALGSGSAVAGALVTSADIKNGTIKTKDLSPKARNGMKGAQGPRGFSAWDPIPSGRTVTGVERWDVESGRANSDFQFTIHLPGVAPAPLTNATVNFAPDTYANDADPACTGTFNAPTAPAGKMCLYLVTSLGNASYTGYALDNSTFGTRHGARVAWGSLPANADSYVELTWAYTAP